MTRPPRMERCPPNATSTVVGEGGGNACAVYVAQPAGDAGGWLIELYADGPHGRFWVRTDVLAPTGPGVPAPRIVCVEHAPGASRFSAVVHPPVTGGDRGIDVAVRCEEAPFAALERMSRALIQYQYDSGAAPGTANVPPGGRVNQISAVAPDGGPGSLTIGGGSTITIPAGRTFSESFADPRKQLVGPCAVAFAAAQSWFVSWVL
ncbi:MAG: hypothetical protein KF718_16840 [Polyangiaceae bacterium]|nr:hypothetical protein [Polyangiaceae bacterium]